MIQAIVFDCFGVLITDALEGLVAELRARDMAAANELVALITAANKGMIAPDVSREHAARLLGMSTDAYIQAVRGGETKNHDLLAYIRELKPSYKVGLLSNVSASGLATRFTEDELARHFDAIAVSGEIGFAKPEPPAYEIIADRLGIRLDACVMIDDREDYCQGARGVGMQAIRYESRIQLRAELTKLL